MSKEFSYRDNAYVEPIKIRKTYRYCRRNEYF